jgi:hypothetical protein
MESSATKDSPTEGIPAHVAAPNEFWSQEDLHNLVKEHLLQLKPDLPILGTHKETLNMLHTVFSCICGLELANQPELMLRVGVELREQLDYLRP